MENNVNNNQLSTKDELYQLEKRLEKKFATKKDLIQLEKSIDKRFATKMDLSTEIRALETRMDIKMENLARNQDDKAQLYRDQILTRIDNFMKKYEVSVQDRDLAVAQTVSLQKRLPITKIVLQNLKRLTMLRNLHAPSILTLWIK